MLGFDVEKLARDITHPFVTILKEFTEQMNKLHSEVQETNRLLAKLVEQGKDDGNE